MGQLRKKGREGRGRDFGRGSEISTGDSDHPHKRRTATAGGEETGTGRGVNLWTQRRASIKAWRIFPNGPDLSEAEHGGRKRCERNRSGFCVQVSSIQASMPEGLFANCKGYQTRGRQLQFSGRTVSGTPFTPRGATPLPAARFENCGSGFRCVVRCSEILPAENVPICEKGGGFRRRKRSARAVSGRPIRGNRANPGSERVLFSGPGTIIKKPRQKPDHLRNPTRPKYFLQFPESNLQREIRTRHADNLAGTANCRNKGVILPHRPSPSRRNSQTRPSRKQRRGGILPPEFPPFLPRSHFTTNYL